MLVADLGGGLRIIDISDPTQPREVGFHLMPTRAYGGDKAYDDTDIHERLAQDGLASAITLKGQRTSKKDGNKERWRQMLAELHASTAPDFSMFAVANRELLDLAQSSRAAK